MGPKLFKNHFLKVVEANYADAYFSFTAVLYQFEMSRSTFVRKVQKEFNSTPQVFLRNYRLEKAAELLEKQNYDVAGIAENCGFNNLSYFNRSFKTKYGNTPTASFQLPANSKK